MCFSIIFTFQVSTKAPDNPPSQVLHSFKRQSSENAAPTSQKLLSPQFSPAILVSPSAIESLMNQAIASKTPEINDDTQDLDGSYVVPLPPPYPPRPLSTFKKSRPPVPERVSSLQASKITGEEEEGVSPISKCANKMPEDMKQSIMTPRSRRPVLAMTSEVQLKPEGISTTLSFPKNIPITGCSYLPEESPCQPPKYNEDEPNEEVETKLDENQGDESESDDETSKYFASLNDAEDECDNGQHDCLTNSTPGVSTERDVSEIVVRTRAYRSKSLKKEFQRYLEANDMESPCDVTDSVKDESSILDASVTSSVIDKEAKMLLNEDMSMSESMLAVMNGDEPKNEKADIIPSVLVPVDVDSSIALSDITEEGDKENEDNQSFTSAKSRLSSSSIKENQCHDIPLPTCDNERKTATSSILIEDLATNKDLSSRGRRKRRSLTEISELNPISQGKVQQQKNIIFETDL